MRCLSLHLELEIRAIYGIPAGRRAMHATMHETLIGAVRGGVAQKSRN
jgi:hypothetical protein